jgi:hypothetical protein
MDNLKLDICPKCGKTHNPCRENMQSYNPEWKNIFTCDDCDIEWGSFGIRDLKKWREAIDRNMEIYNNPPELGVFTKKLIPMIILMARATDGKS